MYPKSYSELVKLLTFEQRFDYLKIPGSVGDLTFGELRWLNQVFYTSEEWRRVRDEVIVRDLGCDLGVYGYEIFGMIVVHHINPITAHDILTRSPKLLDPENLICVSDATHKALHYGTRATLPVLPTERRPNDMCPWKK